MTEQQTTLITDDEYDDLVRSLLESENSSLYEIRLALLRKNREGIIPFSRTLPWRMIDSLVRLGVVSDKDEDRKKLEDERMEYAMRGLAELWRAT